MTLSDQVERIKRITALVFGILLVLQPVMAQEEEVEVLETLSSNLSSLMEAIVTLTQYIIDLVVINMEIWHLGFLIFELLLGVTVVLGVIPFTFWVINKGFEGMGQLITRMKRRARK